MQTKVILAGKASRTDKAQKGYKSVILEMHEKKTNKKKTNNPKTTKRKSSPRAPEVEKKIELTTNKATIRRDWF